MNAFDGSGNLTQVSAPNGQVTTFNYDGSGNLAGVVNTDGHTLVTNTYDTTGQLTDANNLDGRDVSYRYDNDGNQIATWYIDTTTQNQVLDLTFYDGSGQVTGTQRGVLPSPYWVTANFSPTAIAAQYLKSSTKTIYDGDAKVVETVSETGLRTDSTYDTRGELIETRQQSQDANGHTAWLVTRTVYDDAGRAVAATDQYVDGASGPIQGTITIYDVDGNVTETDRKTGMEIDLVGSGTALHSVLTTSGTLITSTTTTYDYANGGRESGSTTENGLQTTMTYDTSGRVILVSRQAIDQSGGTQQTVWLDTNTVYDNLGRVVLVTDEHVRGSPPFYATQTQYDSLGREIKTLRLSGVLLSTAGGVSLVTNPGTQLLWQTQTFYDSEGRVNQRVAADGEQTLYEYNDPLGRETAEMGRRCHSPTWG